MRRADKFPDGGSFETPPLPEFSPQEVQAAMRFRQRCVRGYLARDSDRFPVAHRQLSRECLDAMGKQAIGHGPVQERGGDAAVQKA